MSQEPQKFQLVRHHSSGRSYENGLSLAAAHAKLGMIAQEQSLNTHIHEGHWGQSTYSTAYKGDDPVFFVQAYVRLQDRNSIE